MTLEKYLNFIQSNMAVLLPSWRWGAVFPSGSAVKNLPVVQETQET